MSVCNVPDCDRPAFCKGRCRMHDQRIRAHGFPDDPRQTVDDRFWPKVEKTESCWLWTAAKSPKGYGVFWNGSRQVIASRHAYETLVGAIPDGLFVLHHCDTPSCVRPDHLWLGTALDNSHDMVAKKRWSRHPRLRGNDHPRSRLTEKIVLDVLSHPEVTNAAWARRLGVNYRTISAVRNGLTWKHLSKGLP